MIDLTTEEAQAGRIKINRSGGPAPYWVERGKRRAPRTRRKQARKGISSRNVGNRCTSKSGTEYTVLNFGDFHDAINGHMS